jgi:hypothetical protein
MAAIERQSAGMFRATDFQPPGCENARCSFHADYIVLPGGRVQRLHPARLPSGCCTPIPAEEGAQRAIAHVSRQWTAPAPRAVDPTPKAAAASDGRSGPTGGAPMRLDDFLDRARTHVFTLSAMAFQDAWTLDLERLHDCCIHVLDPTRGLVPFCAFNLTAADGRALYRR